MTPEENFKFLNSYLGHMGPIVDEHQGFIDKYLGDGIMALFRETPDDAIRAAIAMKHKLKTFNEGRKQAGYIPVKIGIGINTGPLMIGTVGVTQRMDSTVLGDHVNLSARLENLTKYYGVDIIISHHTLELLKNKKDFDYRELDWLKVKGKTQLVRIYEVFNHETDEIRNLKKQSIPLIQEGLALRQNREWSKAISVFQAIQGTKKNDLTATFHVTQCQFLQNNPPDDNWDGAIEFTIK